MEQTITRLSAAFAASHCTALADRDQEKDFFSVGKIPSHQQFSSGGRRRSRQSSYSHLSLALKEAAPFWHTQPAMLALSLTDLARRSRRRRP